MANIIVVGAQWGDEGKAKITDLLAEDADVVIRCQGGCNAGHTVKHNNQIFKFHLIPSGMLYPEKVCIIGPGTVIDVDVLLSEISELETRGFNTRNLRLSNRAHMTLPYHILLDKAQETSLAKGKIGTTGRGIGPTYMDKVGRFGLRVADLYEPEPVLTVRLQQLLAIKQPIFSTLTVPETLSSLSLESLRNYCHEAAEVLRPYVCDTVALVHEAVFHRKNILFEGAQGTLLDVDYGTYPYVTSSNATAGGACTGSGIGPTKIDAVIGVMKAYTTRVGEGPFPTELSDTVGNHLVTVGQEFGTTTGRQRRCGWFDAVIAKYSAQVNGLDGLAITKLDVLDGLSEIKLCTAYRHRETGALVTDFPASIHTLSELEPVYETFPGWPDAAPLHNVTRYDELPLQARRYLERIEALTGVPVVIISVGPERNQTIRLRAFQNRSLSSPQHLAAPM